MRVNSLTSNFLTRARVPLDPCPTDRDVIAACLDTCWRIDRAEARMVLIPNTLELTTLWVTPALGRRGRGERAPRFETAFQADSRSTPTGTLTRDSCSPRASAAGAGRAARPDDR